ncbi:MAG: amino acid ABC transporter substrate-binding protein, partial [Hyphomicrobiaceae bacterium]
MSRLSAAVIAALACAGVVFGVSGSAAVAGAKLDAIKSRGQIVCGVNTGLAGFALADSSGRWQGLDVDVCRAVAAALFGDPGKVRFVPLNAQ